MVQHSYLASLMPLRRCTFAVLPLLCPGMPCCLHDVGAPRGLRNVLIHQIEMNTLNTSNIHSRA